MGNYILRFDMKEALIKSLASVFRKTPYFRGKHRISLLIHGIMRNEDWSAPEFLVKNQDGSIFLIDVRSETHHLPFWCGIYDTPLIDKFSRLFAQDWVVMDVGANIGYYSIPFARHLQSIGGMVYAFEPFSANYTNLCKAIEVNALHNIKPYKIALGEQEATLEISMVENGNTGNSVILNDVLKTEAENGLLKVETISVVSLDDFARNNKIERCDFIKIDIEGYEIYFLRGAKEFIKKYRPIIYGEFSSYFIEKFGYSLQELSDFCQENNYKIYSQVKINERKLTRFEAVNGDITGLEDLLLVPGHFSSDYHAKWIK